MITRLFLILITALILFASLLVGPAPIGLDAAILGLMGQADGSTTAIMREVRFPRALGALTVGAGLGASGAALQGFTRNDLAAPGLLGFSACAALGAVATLYFGQRHLLMPAAILGALIGAAIIAIMSRRQVGAAGLILAGIGIGALATAITGLVMNLAPNPWALSELTYWLMGSLEHVDPSGLQIAIPLTVVGLIALWRAGPSLRALALGEDTATSLGVSLPQVQTLIIAGTALAIGSGVAIAGAIGFVGLFIPHIMRRISGPDPAKLILQSALAGGGFLLLTDLLARLTAGPGTPLYLGIVTSLIGVPFFLYLALKRSGS